MVLEHLFMENDNHRKMLHWWRAMGKKRMVVVHFDAHHDLGESYPTKSNEPLAQDVLGVAIYLGLIKRIFWIVPFNRNFLIEKGGLKASVSTLPQIVQKYGEDFEPGRWRAVIPEFVFELRGCDDLPDQDAIGACEISFDLDFFYQPQIKRPPFQPVKWLNYLVSWMTMSKLSGRFLAWSFHGGYTPPTYRPLTGLMKHILIHSEQPKWCSSVWNWVISAELNRTTAKLPLRIPDLPPDILAFTIAWEAYIRGEYERAAILCEALQPNHRFHPSEELMSAYESRCRPNYNMCQRVYAASSFFQPCPSDAKWILNPLIEVASGIESLIKEDF